MGGPMRMNPPRVMGGMGPQVDTHSCPFSTRLSSGSRPKSNATGLKPCYFSLVTCAESRVLLPPYLSLCPSRSWQVRCRANRQLVQHLFDKLGRAQNKSSG